MNLIQRTLTLFILKAFLCLYIFLCWNDEKENIIQQQTQGSEDSSISLDHREYLVVKEANIAKHKTQLTMAFE